MANDHVKMFTEEYGPIAEQVSKQTGIAPSVLLAQWGMESSYGRKPVGQFNLGNIKDMSGAGTEAVDNKTKSKDKYLNFESPEAFGDYYANLMRRLYPKTLNTGSDISAYAEGLRNGVKGSYAEDENYEKVMRGAYQVTSGFYKDPEVKNVKVNPFEGYESESSKFKREQAERDQNKKPEDNPEDKQGGISAPEMGALVGAGANALLPKFTDPQMSPKIDTSRAQEANLSAQDKLELARRNLEAVSPPRPDEPPMVSQSLEERYQQNQGELERLKNEQRLAQERLRALPRGPAAIEPPAAPPAQNEAASRTKAGASGAVNYVNAMSDDVPEVLANQALNMRKDNPRGGQAIIDANTRAIQKQADLGLGDYGLTRTAGGVELALPPTTVAERQADIDKQNQANQAELERRTEETRIQQEAQARQLEQQRLSIEAELERVRQQRAQVGQQQNALSGQLRRMAPLQRAVTKAETDAEIAQSKLARAQQQPSALGRVFEGAGVGSTKMGALPRAATGAGLGYLGVMSYQEALARFKAGDTSEGVLKALEAGAAGAALLPPAGKTLTRARGAGVVGLAGLGGVEFGRRVMKNLPPEE